MENKTIAMELGLKESQVASTVKLLDEENTVPFIARYRKEATGELDENQIRAIEERVKYLRNLAARKEEVLRLIDEQGKLSEELKEAIIKSDKLREVEDLYRPYKQKRRTRATVARERGLEPLALRIMAQQDEAGSIEELAAQYI
ncbi:MAG: RNA-binding transcriptional accessory protein, partial [Firmicutes bacterium]|nr:RNA-binding transcriptional accessory protein [Bacillota bacterium]